MFYNYLLLISYMKKAHKNWMIWGGILVAVVAVFLFASGGDSSGPGEYDEFAQCLTDSGAVMYGAYWCGHCQDQKERFGNSWDRVNYVECDPRGDNSNPELCQQKGITGYPTWHFGDGQVVSGTQSMQALASRTGCQLN